MPPLLLVLAMVAWTMSPSAEACSSSISKRPSRPSQPTTPQPRPTPEPAAARTNVTFPTYKCPHTYDEYYCLNEGKCFIVLIRDSPLYNCECKDGFDGQRCEYKNLDGSYLLSRGRFMLETASIAGGATVAVFLAVVVCFWAWVRLHARSKEPPNPGAAHLVAVHSGTRCLHIPTRTATQLPT